MCEIVIADDHALVRDGLRMNLEAGGHRVVGEASTGREALAKVQALSPDVVVMDVTMPELNGIEATRLICRDFPAVRVLMVSMHNSSEHVHRALDAGAKGYLLKESAGDEVVTAVRALLGGRTYLGAGVAEPPSLSRHGHKGAKSPLESLSNREREILQLVVEGKSSAEIAALMSLSAKTIDTYRSRTMQKLGVSNLTSLVGFAYQHGITPPGRSLPV